SEPSKSVTKRAANLRLDEDGTLEGDVVVEYSGQAGIVRKYESDSDSPAEREKALIDSIKSRIGTAEVTAVRIDNANDPDKPLVHTYHIKAPGYAQRTGKRLFLQPAFFEHGMTARFQTNQRKYPIYFHYPWSESDTVKIDLPAGYELDNPDAPAPLTSGTSTKYVVTIQVAKDKKTIYYKRDFFFGGGGSILFPATTYPNLKQLFDIIHERDEHTMSLKAVAPHAN
ncbi:MAG TPA: hypothetical protein VLZ81_13955, partial [Blastocatellia bacterium]|nr:hypothetical protein [Blastocatellia bacterium]